MNVLSANLQCCRHEARLGKPVIRAELNLRWNLHLVQSLFQRVVNDILGDYFGDFSISAHLFVAHALFAQLCGQLANRLGIRHDQGNQMVVE